MNLLKLMIITQDLSEIENDPGLAARTAGRKGAIDAVPIQ